MFRTGSRSWAFRRGSQKKRSKGPSVADGPSVEPRWPPRIRRSPFAVGDPEPASGRPRRTFIEEEHFMQAHRILILGASYGSLLGVKLALAGHTVKLVCLPNEAELINREGAVVRMPVKGREGLVEVNSKTL